VLVINDTVFAHGGLLPIHGMCAGKRAHCLIEQLLGM